MANEISNISHASVMCTLFTDPTAPTIQAAWGFDERAGFTRQSAAGPGIYTIPLSRPIGARTGPAGETISQGAILSLANFAAGPNHMEVSLVRADFALPAPPDADIQLALLLIGLFDGAGGSADVPMICHVNVWRLPAQD